MADKSVQLTFWATPEERDRWKAAAQSSGLSLSAWVRRVLDLAASPLLVEYGLPSAEDVAEAKRLAEETSKQPNRLVTVPRPKGKPELCDRCKRLGNGRPLPACQECNR